MRNLKIIVLAMAAILVCSCQKDEERINNTTLPLLKQLIFVDTLQVAPNDTIRKIIVNYDMMNRVTSKIDILFEQFNDTSQIISYYYSYTSSDTLASKIIKVKKDFGTTTQVYRDTTYFNFENQKLESDSTRQNGYRYQVNRYLYSSNLINLSSKIFIQPSTQQWDISSNVFQTKSNNNITYQIDTVVSRFLGTPTDVGYDRFERNISYLSNFNPMYKVAQPIYNQYLFDEDYLFEGSYESQSLISQEISSLRTWYQVSTSTGSYDKLINYNYTFRSDGLPSEARMRKEYTNVGVTTIDHWKLIYEYVE